MSERVGEDETQAADAGIQAAKGWIENVAWREEGSDGRGQEFERE